jgi:hypothetical protein
MKWSRQGVEAGGDAQPIDDLSLAKGSEKVYVGPGPDLVTEQISCQKAEKAVLIATLSQAALRRLVTRRRKGWRFQSTSP